MSPELRVCNRVLLCISKFVMEKDLKLIYEEGSKISKYVVYFCVYPYALHIYGIFMVHEFHLMYLCLNSFPQHK